MKQYLFIGVVVAIIITFSLLIIPRKAELGLMYKKGHQYDLAKYEFKKQSNEGDLSIKVTIPLMELFLHFGEIDQAIDLIERFVKENPKDISAHEILGKLYRDGMMPLKYISNLEKILQLELTEKRLRELISLHQTQGKPERALELLKTLIKKFPAKPEDHFALAFLQAKNGNLSDAAQILKIYEEKHPQSVSIDMKELEVHLFLDLDQLERGREKASHWLEKNFSYSSLTRMVQLFRSKNQNPSALHLMRTFDGLLKETGQGRPRPWNPKINRQSPKGLLVAKLKDSPNETLVKSLGEDYIDLKFQSLSKKEALAKMNELSNREKLPVSLMQEYIDLALELKEYPLLFKIVLEASPENVGKEVLFNLSEITLSADVGDSMEKVLKKFGDGFLSTRPFLGVRLMNHLKNKESTFYWLEKFETQPNLTLDQQIELIHFYDKLGVPERAKTKIDINGLQLLITKKLGEPELLISKKKELVNTLMRFDFFKPALPHLKTLAKTEGKDWKFYYEKALLRLKLTSRLVKFWEGGIKSNDLTLEEKRNIIFQLLEKKLKVDAEKLLKILAKNAPPESPDVLHLLFLWGPSVTAESQKWLISQARASQEKDLAGWVKHLVQVGAAQDAVAIVKTKDLSNKALFDSFLQALQVLENKDLIMTEVAEKLVTEKNADKLFRYGKLAEDLGLYETAILAYEKILDEKPGNEKIIKKLAFVYYYQKKWAETEFYLENYLDEISLEEISDDWKTIFYFAEAVFSQGKISKSKKYYLQVLENTQSKTNKPFDLKLARATCLHRLGEKKEALLAYKNLLAKNSDNEKFRAHYIGALMDFREFDQAQALLKAP